MHGGGGGMCGRGVCMAVGVLGARMAGGMHGRRDMGVCMAGGMHGGGHAWQGQYVWQGVCVAEGACMAASMCDKGCVWQGGHVWQERWPLQL